MHNIKKIYLFAVSLISLVIMVIAGIILINLGLKTWIFTKADIYYDVGPCISGKSSTDTGTIPCSEAEAAMQKKAYQDNRASQKQSDAAQALAMLIVASPVFYFHWRLARKEA